MKNIKKIFVILLSIGVVTISSISAFAAVSPQAHPEKRNESMISPNTGYSTIASIGAISVIAASSCAGVILTKKLKSE